MSNGEHVTLERLFNTPLESALRSLMLLSRLSPLKCDLHRLKIFDYFLLHSGDVEHGPASLHPPSPFRSGELLIRQKLIKQGLTLLIAKGLAEVVFDSDGINYRATELAGPFMRYFESPYATRAMQRAEWVATTFASMSDRDLQQYVDSNLGRWGTEFTNEVLVEEDNE
jgi:hypothetical protein